MKSRQWQDRIMFILGVWLLVSPFVLRYDELTGFAALNSYILGIGVAIFAAAALIKPQMWEEWINLVLGMWLIVAPYVLGFSSDMLATANHVIVGVLVAGDAALAMLQKPMRKVAPK